jgi:hypothetical protein
MLILTQSSPMAAGSHMMDSGLWKRAIQEEMTALFVVE